MIPPSIAWQILGAPENSGAVEASDGLSPVWLLLPAVAWLASAVFLFWIVQWQREKIDHALVTSAKLRSAFMVIAVGFIPFLGVIAVEVADFSDLANLKVLPSSLVACTFVGPLSFSFLAGQYILWFHDYRADIRIQEAEEQRDEARADRDFFMLICKTHVSCIERHKARLVECLKRSSENGSAGGIKLPAVLATFAANAQLVEFIATLHQLFVSDATRRFPGQDVTVRAGLFRVDTNQSTLSYVYAWDGTTAHCLTSPEKHVQRFNLTNPMDCLAVYSAVNRHLMVIEDAEEANASSSSPFNYFDTNQRAKIKSILALPLPSVDGASVSYVVCVDSNVKKMFESDKTTYYDKLVSNLAPRLHEVELVEGVLKQLSMTASRES